MSLNQLFRNARRAALKKAALTVVLTASAVGIILTKAVNSNGEVMQTASPSSAQSRPTSSESFAAFAATPLVPPAETGSRGASNFDATKCIQNPSMDNCNNDSLSQNDWDRFLPPEGIVLRDGRGRVIFKKCRNLTEGAKTAKAEMESERDRFNKFNTAMTLTVGSIQNYRDDNDYLVNCDIKSNKAAPIEEPCPTLKNYTEVKDFYRQQYYEMSNKLQDQAKIHGQCIRVRDQVMTAVDPTWKNDRSIASQAKAVRAATSNNGVR